MFKDSSPSFPIWKSLTIGTALADANAFRTAHKRANCGIKKHPDQLLSKITIAKEPTVLDLVRCSVAELGFKDGAYFKDIVVRAQELGLSLCPSEVGPQLCLLYHDQPLGEWTAVAMEPIMDSDGYLLIFAVERCSVGPLLSAYWGDPSDYWCPDDCLVFVHH